MTVESLKAADALLALAGLMNDQKMLKELRVTRDEANASHHQSRVEQRPPQPPFGLHRS